MGRRWLRLYWVKLRTPYFATLLCSLCGYYSFWLYTCFKNKKHPVASCIHIYMFGSFSFLSLLITFQYTVYFFRVAQPVRAGVSENDSLARYPKLWLRQWPDFQMPLSLWTAAIFVEFFTYGRFLDSVSNMSNARFALNVCRRATRPLSRARLSTSAKLPTLHGAKIAFLRCRPQLLPTPMPGMTSLRLYTTQPYTAA
jgi:hypothetical protein